MIHMNKPNSLQEIQTPIRYIEKDNMTDLWNTVYETLITRGETSKSRVGLVRRLTNVTLILTNPLQSVTYSTIRKLSPGYLAAELYWYLEGRNDLEYIGEHAKMWKSLSDDGETVNSAYGFVMLKKFGFDQLEKAISDLTADITSRQAIIHFKTPTIYKSEDVLCTVSLQFMYSNGRLNAHTYMRSNDIWFGTPYDIVFFTVLQQIVAGRLGVALGEYHHTVGDLHLYYRNLKEQAHYDVSTELRPDFVYSDQLKDACMTYADGEQRGLFDPEAFIVLEKNQ